MTESGGVSAQAGIFYQNSVAALALADLLDLSPLPPRERVVEVRVEAPEDVDDIIIRYADGHRQFQNVKTSVAPGSDAWVAMWRNLHKQFSLDFSADDQLIVIFQEPSATARDLAALCDRAASSVDLAEWHSRLTRSHHRLLTSVVSVVGSPATALELLRRTTVRTLTLENIEGEFARRRLGGDFVLPSALLTTLRDIAGAGARKRALFLAAKLRRRLVMDHDIQIADPPEWGLPAYRAMIARLARIEIPGTGVSGSTDELFVWPRARPYECMRPSDFEDEYPSASFEHGARVIDMRFFPSDQLDRCVIVAGPGYGKSALLTAIAARLAKGPYVPIIVPLASFVASEASIVEFLATQTNRELDIKVDWRRLAEQGLLVLLFDGLDEIPSGVRPALRERLSIFSARYPLAPWMLTVRDPAILAGATDAEIIELLPLEDADIERFVETMKRRLEDIDTWAFVSKLKMYPDLDRLARIPLFLTMLLATIRLDDNLPLTRSDLIEAYLKTLFAPHEHKVMKGVHDSSATLREIAEALAFAQLERQEIGTSEREVREIVSRQVEDRNKIEPLFERLRANGILRQQSAIRLQFPFPIVQEYLAACHLVRHFPDLLASRIDDAIQRPWAQVIQFALEQHLDPTRVMRIMLDRADDAFGTSLRLVGRCIANGARVDSSLRNEVGNKLVRYWVDAPTRARERIGRLLADGFADPISPALREALHHRWLLNDGGGEIVSKANDTVLTLSVLAGLMDRGLDRFTIFHSLKPAMDAAGDVAFNAIIARIHTASIADEQLEGLGDLLDHFSSGSVSRRLALEVARNGSLPHRLRLRAFRVAGSPLDEEAYPLIRELLESDYAGHYLVSRLLSLYPGRAAVILQVLRNDQLSLKHRRELAGQIAQIFLDTAERAEFIGACLAGGLDSELTTILLLFAARFSDHAAFEMLIERIPENPTDLVGQTIALFGHHPGRGLAERAADLTRACVHTSKEAAQLSGSVTTGMLYIYEMDYAFGGTLRYTHPHAGAPRWMELLEDWSDRNDLTDVQRLTLLTAASKLGSDRARARLEAKVLALADPDDPKFEEDDYGHAISSAIREARRHHLLLPLDLAERFVRCQRPNVPLAGVAAIEAHGSRKAIELMITLHGEIAVWHLRDALANAIESLASRLGLVVRNEDDSYIIAT